ncbi:hypothetical protein CK203_050052 [Vitis vinifera]|uniref:Reverse transcriptase Ty1/copia-type domain-containing protein n=1 Tax=Vitis vinifera TaxID=29760 RepID=A0A438H4F7_VITVI|nr:hypothetical protein CK203_050052 [Vitis vinifera]
MKTTKGSQSIVEYMQTTKIIIDDFVLMGYPLSEDEIILHVLNGLGNDFKEINAAIRARDSSVTFEELHDKLQDQETLLKQDDTSRETPRMTARFHHKFSNHKGNSEKSGGHPGGNFNNKGLTTNLGNRNIFDNQRKNIVQVDSGASRHITLDLQNLSLYSDYGGNKDIMIGDGSGIPITHGTLIEDVFMQQPQGFLDPQFPQHVCKLQKAIYCLHQAPRACEQALSIHALPIYYSLMLIGWETVMITDLFPIGVSAVISMVPDSGAI